MIEKSSVLKPLCVCSKLTRFANVFFACGFIFFLYNYAVSPISDLDFWWHLKTGDLIFQQGGLLQTDPFTFTADGMVSSRESLILRGYWLWQVTASVLFKAFGFNGIYLFNFLVISIAVGLIFKEMQRCQVEWLIILPLLVAGLLLFSSIYPLERPQILSFLFSIILLGMLSRVREGDGLGLKLPLLMVFWANFHGGFLVGDLILICFAIGVLIEYRHDYPRMKHLLSWVSVGIGASLLNPNLGLAFSETFTLLNSGLMTGVWEYQSTWTRFIAGHWSIAVLWLLIATYIVGCWVSGRRYWPEGLVVFFLAYFSTAYMRNVGFFALAMLPVIGFHLHKGVKLYSWRMAPVAGAFIIFLCGSYLWWQGSELWQIKAKQGHISQFFPVESSDFIQVSGLQGRMFNSYDFGGYQIWKLYPEHRVFIDGRGLDPDIFDDWKLIASASLEERGGHKEFEVLLDRYRIEYVVQPHVYMSTGRLTPLVKFLLTKPEWIPVYIDQKSYIIVRSTVKNAEVIKRYRLGKRDFNNRLIAYLTAACKNWPSEVIYQVGLTEMLIFVGRYSEAEVHLVAASRIDPSNDDLNSLRNQLDVLSKDNSLKP